MTLYEYMDSFSIAIICLINADGNVRTIKSNKYQIESDTLFKQLIVHSDPHSIIAQTEDQMLPRMWEQGDSQCTIMKKDSCVLCAFYDCSLPPLDKIKFAMKMNSELEHVDISWE